jgi:hypothetical protein
MNELLLSIVLGALLFFAFLVLALRGLPETGHELALERLRRMVPLGGLRFTRPDLLFRACDYEWLESRAELRGLVKQLRRDRRSLVQSWLRLLAGDVKTLWRFRRFLARNGVPVGMLEEIRVAATAWMALAWLASLRILVFWLGPFAVASLLNEAQGLVERTLRLSAGLLRHLPQATWTEVERRWSREAA